MNPKDILTFEKFLTPTVIKIVYWIALVGAVLAGLGTIAQSLDQDSAIGLITGVVMIVVGPIYVRVLCEVILVVFRISTDLSAIRTSKENGLQDQDLSEG